MKRFPDGSLLLETDYDKKVYIDACINVHNLVDFKDNDPVLFEIFCEENKQTLDKLSELLKGETKQ